jgi:hypothetical protein
MDTATFWVAVILVGPGQQITVRDNHFFQTEVQCRYRAEALAIEYSDHPASTYCQEHTKAPATQPKRSCRKDGDIFNSAVLWRCN